MKKPIIYIAVFIALILAYHYLNVKCNPQKVITKTDTVKIIKYKDSLRIDTIIKAKHHIIEKYITITDTDTIFQFDTIKETIYKYYAKNVYIDTILHDKNGLIILTDTIYKNTIASRKSEISMYKQKNNYLVPGMFITNNDNKLNLGVNLTFEQQKNVFGIGISKDNYYVSYGRKFKINR